MIKSVIYAHPTDLYLLFSKYEYSNIHYHDYTIIHCILIFVFGGDNFPTNTYGKNRMEKNSNVPQNLTTLAEHGRSY